MAIVSGTVTVTSAGTAQQAPDKGNVYAIIFKARQDNAGKVFVSDSSVSTSNGWELAPGEASPQLILVDAVSTTQFYADAEVSNDQVDFFGVY